MVGRRRDLFDPSWPIWKDLWSMLCPEKADLADVQV